MSPDPSGFRHLPAYLDPPAQAALRDAIRDLLRLAPLYRPAMPGSGRPMSVRMSNAGPLGWVADKAGYRYQAHHPLTGRAWPPMPPLLLGLWDALTDYPAAPEACLINYYDAEAKMGLHRDQDESAADAPVLSISLGDSARFRLGGPERRGKTVSLKLNSGDIVLLAGAARHCYHGVDRIFAGSSRLLSHGGRLNLTLRRVTDPAP